MKQREGTSVELPAHDAGVVAVSGGDDELHEPFFGGDELVSHVSPQLLLDVGAHLGDERLALQHPATKHDALRTRHHHQRRAEPRLQSLKQNVVTVNKSSMKQLRESSTPHASSGLSSPQGLLQPRRGVC